MTLILEIEFLTGVTFAAQGPESDLPDWPPQPDRVFSALIASWGASGSEELEAAALRWLEEQQPPLITASATEPRTAPLAYVPPNDPSTGRSGDRAVLPSFRRRQPRRFPASRPHNATVLYRWDAAAPTPVVFEALRRLAADTAYVGHSSSLTRCRFTQSEELPIGDGQMPTRRIYKGRLDELRESYETFVRSSGKVGRPQPGAPVIPKRPRRAEIAQSCFSPEWLLLERTGGEMPDIRAAALLAKEIRDTILSGFNKCGLGDRIPPEISGHTDDGEPLREPHVAIVPLAFAGFPYADGSVLGFALVPPRKSRILENPNFQKAMRTVAAYDTRANRWELRLRYFELKLSPTIDASKRSLEPARYSQASRSWGTVTPIVLDRHLKATAADRDKEIAAIIRLACRNTGLPEPETVTAYKHPAIEGVPSSRPSGKAPAWMGWRLPTSLASRQLTHAVIRFGKPIKGPVILGAGRFVGLGLCLPIGDVGTLA